MTHIICHYGEIALKGKNRPFFEKKLQENIKRALQRAAIPIAGIDKIDSRIVIKCDSEEWEKITSVLKEVFGVVNFAPAVKVKTNTIQSIQNACLELLRIREFKTFRIDTTRSDKKYYSSSQKVNEQVGAFIVSKLNKGVDLKNPDMTCFIEITTKGVFVLPEKIKGAGGMPIGSGGKALTLLSGGIDSPVAANLIQKRGVRNDFIHFHSYPNTAKESIEKVKKLVSVLNKYQFESKLYLVPFSEIQKTIVALAPDKLRIILYRRFMARIAEIIANENKILALVTGESVGQVASQTLENISVVWEVINMPVLRPLAGMDKNEIVTHAKKINTYKISIEPCDDTCSLFMPKNPATKAKSHDVKTAEKKLDIEKMIREGIEASSVEKI